MLVQAEAVVSVWLQVNAPFSIRYNDVRCISSSADISPQPQALGPLCP